MAVAAISASGSRVPSSSRSATSPGVARRDGGGGCGAERDGERLLGVRFVVEYLDHEPDPEQALAVTFGAAPTATVPPRDTWRRG